MNIQEAPKYQWGQPVCVIEDLFNDGTFPDWPEDALLVPSGGLGEIVQIGTHVETKSIIYLVEFAEGRVIGCLEDEIAAADSARPMPATESQPR